MRALRSRRLSRAPCSAGAEAGAKRRPPRRMMAHDERNAYALAAGKQLLGWYNCSGCHANGGGGSGPRADGRRLDLRRRRARRSSRPSREGRPNGMPAFGSRIPEDQIWQLAAYVRSMAGLAPQDAAPNRDDAFLTRTPESFMDPQKPETAKPSSRQRAAAMNGIHDVRVPGGPAGGGAVRLVERDARGVHASCSWLIIVALAVAVWRAPRATERRAPTSRRIREESRRCGARSAMRSPSRRCCCSCCCSRASSPTARSPRCRSTTRSTSTSSAINSGGRPATTRSDPCAAFATANELHVPVGRPVLMRLRADDVIHSFWVPSLAGKKDLIPGPRVDDRVSRRSCRASTAASARSSAATSTRTWRSSSSRTRPPTTSAGSPRSASPRWRRRLPQEQRGRDLVEQASCAMCHTIAGTRGAGPARARPDPCRQAARRWPPARLPNTAAARAALDRRSAAVQARRRHAAAGRRAGRPRRDLRVPRVAAMTAASGSVSVEAASRATRARRRRDRKPARVGTCATARAPASAGRRGARAHVDRQARRDRLPDRQRPQDDRPALHRHGAVLLRRGRRDGRPDAPPARDREQPPRRARLLQPAVHDARHDDDVPVRRAGDAGLRALHRAADDRHAQHRVSAHDRLRLLALPVRRTAALRRVPVQHRCRTRAGSPTCRSPARNTASASAPTSGTCSSPTARRWG